jgi:hypothetical protein
MAVHSEAEFSTRICYRRAKKFSILNFPVKSIENVLRFTQCQIEDTSVRSSLQKSLVIFLQGTKLKIALFIFIVTALYEGLTNGPIRNSTSCRKRNVLNALPKNMHHKKTADQWW